MKVIIDLNEELSPAEIQSFMEQAKLKGRDATEHALVLLFGEKVTPEAQPTTEEDR